MARLKTAKSIDDKILECEEKHGKLAQKAKVENQNQTHNVRQEGIAPINQKL